jgi:hypothetical protein
MDLSLQGASLKTMHRPPIGELIRIGRTFGRVTYQHEHGIGVEFTRIHVCEDAGKTSSPVTHMGLLRTDARYP